MDGIERFGKPEEVLSDQGRQYFAWRGKSDFQRLLVREGIQHVVSRTHHPETLGKCERLWETVGVELWQRVQPQDLGEARERLGCWSRIVCKSSCAPRTSSRCWPKIIGRGWCGATWCART